MATNVRESVDEMNLAIDIDNEAIAVIAQEKLEASQEESKDDTQVIEVFDIDVDVEEVSNFEVEQFIYI